MYLLCKNEVSYFNQIPAWCLGGSVWWPSDVLRWPPLLIQGVRNSSQADHRISHQIISGDSVCPALLEPTLRQWEPTCPTLKQREYAPMNAGFHCAVMKPMLWETAMIRDAKSNLPWLAIRIWKQTLQSPLIMPMEIKEALLFQHCALKFWIFYIFHNFRRPLKWSQSLHLIWLNLTATNWN